MIVHSLLGCCDVPCPRAAARYSSHADPNSDSSRILAQTRISTPHIIAFLMKLAFGAVGLRSGCPGVGLNKAKQDLRSEYKLAR